MSLKIEYYKRTPTSAYVIGECDGANLQARIAASLSHDPDLVNLFLSGGDFHSNNAYYIMAQYQEFDEVSVIYEDGSQDLIMEWSAVDIKRTVMSDDKLTASTTTLEHQVPTEIQPGDTVNSKVVCSALSRKRKLTGYEEFAKNAKKGRLKELRTTAKLIGFGMLFGMSASAFANGTLRMEWDADRCKMLIAQLHLEQLYLDLSHSSRKMTGDELLYLTVATFFRTEFFKLYPVLEKWILQCGEDASVVGYARSPFGARRLLPQLTYQGKHSDKAEIKNLSNIAVNSPVQDYETIYMSRIMIETNKKYEEMKLDAIIVGTVHDSIVLFAHRDIYEVAFKILLEEFAFTLSEFNGIPYEGECNVADPLLGEVWGMGKKELTVESLKDIVVPTFKYTYALKEEAPILTEATKPVRCR